METNSRGAFLDQPLSSARGSDRRGHKFEGHRRHDSRSRSPDRRQGDRRKDDRRYESDRYDRRRDDRDHRGSGRGDRRDEQRGHGERQPLSGSSNHGSHPSRDHPGSNGSEGGGKMAAIGTRGADGRHAWTGAGARDSKLPSGVSEDPRKEGALGKAQMAAMGLRTATSGRNTESFDPASTLVRPSMRIVVGPNAPVYDRPIKHDDVIIVPEFFCKEDDWSLYYQLLEEMTAAQASGAKKSEWISWAEGAHLISKGPEGSPAFQKIQDQMGDYFRVTRKSVGTRFNWYRDPSDWKPYHHDSAAFDPFRARNQNCTIGVSFGAERELGFLHAKDSSVKMYFPQKNGTLFFFGRDVNINWKHGINALTDEEQERCHPDSRGRISIILWGNAENCVAEAGDPPMLPSQDHGKGGGKGKGKGKGKGR